MTTRVAIVVPAPGHNRVRLIFQDKGPDGWTDTRSQDVEIGSLTDHVTVWDGRRVIIEEIE
jgi:hypothetical protein